MQSPDLKTKITLCIFHWWRIIAYCMGIDNKWYNGLVRTDAWNLRTLGPISSNPTAPLGSSVIIFLVHIYLHVNLTDTDRSRAPTRLGYIINEWKYVCIWGPDAISIFSMVYHDFNSQSMKNLTNSVNY